MIQICVDCKKEFEDPAPAHGGSRKQRCAACQKLHTKQLQAAARERHRAAKIAKAKAEAKEKKAAAEAAAAIQAEQTKPTPAPASAKKGTPHFAEKAKSALKGKSDHLSIEEVTRMADAEGMSYGQYVALKLNRIGSTF